MNKEIRSSIIKFEEHTVKVIRGDRQGIEWICLNDICEALKRGSMIESGEAMKLCPSALKMAFKVNGREYWGIRVDDLYKLLIPISKENRPIAELCKRMEKWVETLPESEPQQRKVETLPEETDVMTFKYKDYHPVRFKAEQDMIMVNATQMAKPFGKSPTAWLRFDSTEEFRQTLVEEGISESMEQQVTASRGKNGGTWMMQELALEFAGFLSSEFAAWCDFCIRSLMGDDDPQVSQVIPRLPVRPAKKEATISYPVPTNMEDALVLIKQLQDKIEEDKHKVEYYNDLVDSRCSFISSAIANELMISTRRLNKFLLENKIVRYSTKGWIVLGQYSSLQKDFPYEWTDPLTNKTNVYGTVKRWTPYGREFIIDLWKSKHPDED